MINVKFKFQIKKLVKLALQEDVGSGDITTEAIIPSGKVVSAEIIAKEEGIIAGLDVAESVFRTIDGGIKFVRKIKEGHKVNAGKVIAVVAGRASVILTAERTALNFIQRLSGIATLTDKFVKAAGNKVKILDTRKTTPGLRALEKYAVSVGGGINHRFGLYDAVLIKDNHITIVGSVKKAVSLAKQQYNKIEVETKTIKQVSEAIDSGATRIMLDNMNVAEIKKAVTLIRRSVKHIEIEASGGINIQNIDKIAKTGVDYISIGALTHSAKALDMSLKISSR